MKSNLVLGYTPDMTDTSNPLIIPILEILKQSSTDLGEYDIIKTLEAQGYQFPVENDTYEMAIFKKHFITMNALYRLQSDLIADGYYLSISPVVIRLESIKSGTGSQQLTDDTPVEVRDYYLDWSHFETTRADDVSAMLNDFWHRYYAMDKQADACQLLGVNAGFTHQELTHAYRRLAAEHHPDKGGDQEKFIEIRQAYEVLCRCLHN